MIKTIVMTMTFGALLLTATASAAFDLYVSSTKAPLYSEPRSGAEKVAEARQGEKLVGLESQGSWYRIDYGGKRLWILNLMVRKTLPPERKTPSKDEVDQMAQSARTRPSAYTTTAGARGLREKRGGQNEKYRLDYDALEKMESFEVTDEEASAFLEEASK
jgi:ribosomal protein L15E